MLGAERAHVQPDRRAAGTAVVEEGDWPALRRRVLLEIRNIKHARNRWRIRGLFGGRDCKLAAGLRLSVRPQLCVLSVSRAHRNGPCDSGVSNVHSASVELALR